MHWTRSQRALSTQVQSLNSAPEQWRTCLCKGWSRRGLCAAATLVPTSPHLSSGGQATEGADSPWETVQASGLDHAHVHFLPREFFRTKHHKMSKDAPVPNSLRVRKQEEARLSPTFKPEWLRRWRYRWEETERASLRGSLSWESLWAAEEEEGTSQRG